MRMFDFLKDRFHAIGLCDREVRCTGSSLVIVSLNTCLT